MSNRHSLDMLFAETGRWLQSRHLLISSDPSAGGPVRDYIFGAVADRIAEPGGATRAARKGWQETEHDKGRAARCFGPAAGVGRTLAEPVAEQVGYYPMLAASTVNLSGVGFFTAIGGFDAARFAVTGQLTGCCFVWDKPNARVAHIRSSPGISGHALRLALGERYTVFGTRGEENGPGEYDIGEDVTILGVNNGGWRFFAQVHVRATRRIQRVVEL